MLVSTSQLNLDCVLIIRSDMPKLEKVSRRARTIEPLRAYIDREILLGQRFSNRLESLNCWFWFEPENAFSEVTGLHTLQDYANNLALHLPEIYEETFCVEKYVRSFRQNQNASAHEQVTAKFEECATFAKGRGANAKSIIAMVASLESVQDTRALALLCAKS
jgi:hypothetical protein